MVRILHWHQGRPAELQGSLIFPQVIEESLRAEKSKKKSLLLAHVDFGSNIHGFSSLSLVEVRNSSSDEEKIADDNEGVILSQIAIVLGSIHHQILVWGETEIYKKS
ncbi:unnamed protein product [Linum trigynum]|uniref:Uncharacterized protein n=1 Tax=Linum trigynum TaxID=586398 RepID=A0AAV2ENS7_9ROSI